MDELTLEMNLERQDIPQDKHREEGIIEEGICVEKQTETELWNSMSRSRTCKRLKLLKHKEQKGAREEMRLE